MSLSTIEQTLHYPTCRKHIDMMILDNIFYLLRMHADPLVGELIQLATSRQDKWRQKRIYVPKGAHSGNGEYSSAYLISVIDKAIPAEDIAKQLSASKRIYNIKQIAGWMIDLSQEQDQPSPDGYPELHLLGKNTFYRLLQDVFFHEQHMYADSGYNSLARPVLLAFNREIAEWALEGLGNTAAGHIAKRGMSKKLEEKAKTLGRRPQASKKLKGTRQSDEQVLSRNYQNWVYRVISCWFIHLLGTQVQLESGTIDGTRRDIIVRYPNRHHHPLDVHFKDRNSGLGAATIFECKNSRSLSYVKDGVGQLSGYLTEGAAHKSLLTSLKPHRLGFLTYRDLNETDTVKLLKEINHYSRKLHHHIIPLSDRMLVLWTKVLVMNQPMLLKTECELAGAHCIAWDAVSNPLVLATAALYSVNAIPDLPLTQAFEQRLQIATNPAKRTLQPSLHLGEKVNATQ